MTEDELKAMTERLDKLEIKLSYMEDFDSDFNRNKILKKKER